MISSFFHTFFYDPLYNGLVFLIDVLPGADVGLAVIILTILVKLILFPLSQKALKTQAILKFVQKEIEEIKIKYKEDRQKMTHEILAVYKKNNVNPFAGFLTLFIQIPVLLALYWMFYKGLPIINVDILYSFVQIPDVVNMKLLNLFDLSQRSLVAAILVGVTQFIQVKLSLPQLSNSNETGLKADFAKSMHMNMKYVLPVILAFVSYSLIAVVSVYWIVSNLFMIGQEVYLRKTKTK
jgi:YidC/Oxa1 family membrane protein insertase